MARREAVIIGAGPNALVAAFYLARAGWKPLVVERRPCVGGVAVTEEFHPGFRCSAVLHTESLDAGIEREMQLARQGFRRIGSETNLFASACDGRGLALSADPRRAAEAISAFSRRDAESFTKFAALLERFGPVVKRVMRQAPPALEAPAAADLWALLKIGRQLRRMDQRDMYRLLRYAPMPVADLVGEWFESEPLRAMLAAQGIFGTALGPRSVGSAAVFLLRAASAGSAVGPQALPAGGLGGLSEAMASAACAAGAEIRTGCEVTQILVKDGAVTGILLAGGEEIAAKRIVSGADPKRTLLRLLDPIHLEPSFVSKLRSYRANGVAAKLHLALDALPSFAGANQSTALAGRIQIGPTLDYLERAFDASKYGEFSAEPYLDVTIPSLLDPSLAPPQKHVMSIWAQFAPFRLRQGDWNARRDELADAVIRALARYAPDLPGKILARQVLTPRDLEEVYGLAGGHPFHGDLALDQLFAMRPLFGWARYRTPVTGLYLCGSGTHPGVALTGLSGVNAAREVIKDAR